MDGNAIQLLGGIDPQPLPKGYEDLMSQMDIVCDTIYESAKKYKAHGLEQKELDDMVDSLRDLQEEAREVASFAREYDYNGIQANGYWSCLRIGLGLGRLFEKKYRNIEPSKFKIDSELITLSKYFLIALRVLRELRKDSKVNDHSLIASNKSLFVDMFGLLLSIEDELVATMYGTYCGFWLEPMARYTMVLLVSTLAVAARPREAFRCLWNAQHRGRVLAKLIKTADVNFVKRMGGLAEWHLYKTILPYLLYRDIPKKQEEFYVRRQETWVICPTIYKLVKEPTHGLNGHSRNNVRCRLFQHLSQDHPPADGRLVFHLHGGGFVCGSPESHEVYLRDWANKLPNVPIVSVDYTVSPEAKFPVALQEILDVYLWLISDDPEVEEILGFRPHQLVFCGDSAGGNLLTALCYIVNDIRKTQGEESHIVMPTALVCSYTPFNLSLLLSPANILACCDSMISAGIMLSCFEAYLPQPMQMKEEDNDTNTWSGFKLFDDDYSAYLFSIKDKFYDVMTDWGLYSKPSKPWYLSQKSDIYAQLEKIKEVTHNPYVSPLFYPDMESLNKVSLHLIALHFDPFLDDSVSMAKKWQGPVTLDVLNGLQHGFLNFMPFVGEAKRGSNLCVEMLRKSLQLDAST